MPVNGTNSWEYRWALIDFTARFGESKGSSTARLARILKKNHSKLRSVNGNVRTIKTFLRDTGDYRAAVDNKNNQPFRVGVKRWLNRTQRGALTPKPPTAHRWARNFKG